MSEIEISIDKVRNKDSDHDNKVRKSTVIVTLEHYTSSTVSDVGLQVWKGSFLLCDYLLSIRSTLCDSMILELGSGCGFCGLVLSMIPHAGCILTDFKRDILSLADDNLARNKHLIQSSPFETTHLYPVFVKQLDWFDMDEVVPSQEDNINQYLWDEADQKLLNSSKRLFIAADVIYDDILTEALFLKLSQMMKSKEVLLLTLEKRYNCTLSSQSVAATGYELFLHIVNSSLSANNPPPLSKFMKKFQGKQININTDYVPQCIRDYERNEQLELWEIVCL